MSNVDQNTGDNTETRSAWGLISDKSFYSHLFSFATGASAMGATAGFANGSLAGSGVCIVFGVAAVALTNRFRAETRERLEACQLIQASHISDPSPR